MVEGIHIAVDQVPELGCLIQPQIQYQQPVQMQQQVHGGQDNYVQVQQAPVHQENFDVRLNDNFKLFICGPSR